MNSILVIAHAPLAHALRQCALHVFPECADDVAGVDVQAQASSEETLAAARLELARLLERSPCAKVLIVADVFGATPCNVAQKLVDDARTRLVAGANLPMLLRAVTYRHEPLDVLVQRALVGGTSGVMQVAAAAPGNQARKKYSDQDICDHQQ